MSDNPFYRLLSDPRNNQQSKGMEFPGRAIMREHHARGDVVGSDSHYQMMMASPYSQRAVMERRAKALAKRRRESREKELVHLTNPELKSLEQIPGAVKDKTAEFPNIAKEGRERDTKVGEINEKTAKALDQFAHQGKTQRNPRTGLREYNQERKKASRPRWKQVNANRKAIQQFPLKTEKKMLKYVAPQSTDKQFHSKSKDFNDFLQELHGHYADVDFNKLRAAKHSTRYDRDHPPQKEDTCSPNVAWMAHKQQGRPSLHEQDESEEAENRAKENLAKHKKALGDLGKQPEGFMDFAYNAMKDPQFQHYTPEDFARGSGHAIETLNKGTHLADHAYDNSWQDKVNFGKEHISQNHPVFISGLKPGANSTHSFLMEQIKDGPYKERRQMKVQKAKQILASKIKQSKSEYYNKLRNNLEKISQHRIDSDELYPANEYSGKTTLIDPLYPDMPLKLRIHEPTGNLHFKSNTDNKKHSYFSLGSSQQVNSGTDQTPEYENIIKPKSNKQELQEISRNPIKMSAITGPILE